MKIFNLFLLLINSIAINALDKTLSLNYLNKYRIIHCVPQLIYDKNIETVATEHAKYIIESGKFEHSSNSFGENIAYTYDVNDEFKAFVVSTDLMYEEKKLYNYSKPGFSFYTGHFTQMVWKSSKYVGIGTFKNDTIIAIVVNYYPPGNVYNDFIENVTPSLECS